ncbi:MAG: hypothetical protein ACLQB1_25895 [Streptosporangiaceae bacterium]
MLATARTHGWWWASLGTEPGLPVITWHEPLLLGPFDATAARQLAKAAGRSFAEKLGWPPPPPLSQHDLDQLARSSAASYELLVLARLYAANTGLSAPQSQRAAAELMLEQELRYWARMYGGDGTEDPYRIRLAPQFMARAVYLATLAGTFGYDIAQPITQLAGLGCYLGPQQIIEDHARCYPADDNPHPHVVRHRMKAVPGDEGGAALFQCRRGLAGTGLLPVPEGVDRVLHGLARHVGISFGIGCLSDSAWIALQRPGQMPATVAVRAPPARVTGGR